MQLSQGIVVMTEQGRCWDIGREWGYKRVSRGAVRRSKSNEALIRDQVACLNKNPIHRRIGYILRKFRLQGESPRLLVEAPLAAPDRVDEAPPETLIQVDDTEKHSVLLFKEFLNGFCSIDENLKVFV